MDSPSSIRKASKGDTTEPEWEGYRVVVQVKKRRIDFLEGKQDTNVSDGVVCSEAASCFFSMRS